MRFSPKLAIALLLGLVLTTVAAASEATPEKLWQAARDGNVEQVKALLKAGVPVNAKTKHECTALYFAANSDHADVINVLVEAGAEVDVRDNAYGFTAVGMAAWLGHANAVGALIDGGAKTEDAIGGLFAAAGNGHADVIRVGLEKLEVPAPQLTALMGTATQAGQDNVVAALKEAGVALPETKPAESEGGGEAETPTEEASVDESEKSAAGTMPELGKPIRVTKAANWPEFRGANRTGIADGQHPPLSFDAETGRNVRWQTPVAGLGLSSPVIWNDRIYITTAVSAETKQAVTDPGLGNISPMTETSPHEWQVLAYDLKSGKEVWKKTANSGVPRTQRHWKASQANPTVATDGKTLIAFFGSHGIHAYDMEGKLLWEKDLGALDAGWFMDKAFEWGFASSPTIDDGRVIVQVDVHGDSFVAAFDLKDGKELWRTARNEQPSWGTPLAYRDSERHELILAASNAVVGYNPKDGKELWRINGNSEITVASPIAQDGMIVATGGYREPRPIYVVKPGAQGDITPEEGEGNDSVVWSTQTEGAYQPTPLLYRGLLYIFRDNGGLTAFEPSTGEEIYKKRVRGRYTASPVAADGRIYFTAENGRVTVAEAGREYKELARSELGYDSLATPAISNGMIVFRTVAGLVGVGFTEEPPASAE